MIRTISILISTLSITVYESTIRRQADSLGSFARDTSHRGTGARNSFCRFVPSRPLKVVDWRAETSYRIMILYFDIENG
jgi:hypothetical protein